MDPIYLPIDRNNKDFQLVHIDVLQSFGVALKFIFNNVNNTFEIIDGKLILATINEAIEQSIEITQDFDTSSSSEYGFRIDLELKKADYNSTCFKKSNSKTEFKKAIYKDGKITKECLIDIHIEGIKTVDEEGLLVKFGTQFCKFYII